MYPEWEMYDEKEEDRLEHLQILKAKGKGAPKKKKSAAGEFIDRSGRGGMLDGGCVLMCLVAGREQEEAGEEEVVSVGVGWVYDMVMAVCIAGCIGATTMRALAGVRAVGIYQHVQLDQTNKHIPTIPDVIYRSTAQSEGVPVILWLRTPLAYVRTFPRTRYG